MEKQLIHSQQLLMYHPKTSFTVISKGRVVFIGFDQITHISKCGSETIIHTGTNKHRTSLSLQEILNDLPVNEFFRVHRSHIVSLKWMTGLKKKTIVVNGNFLPLTAYCKVQLCKRLQEILNDRYHLIAYER